MIGLPAARYGDPLMEAGAHAIGRESGGQGDAPRGAQYCPRAAPYGSGSAQEGDRMLESAQARGGRKITSRASLTRIGKFVLVGGSGMLVNTGALVVLYQHLHIALAVASALATELAVANNFVWNNYWTFGQRVLSLRRFARFNAVSLAGQCITIVTLWALVREGGVHYIVANVAGVGLAFTWNFVANARWTWGPATVRRD
jgi:putative flippase GtrA